ncbi:prenylcysteine oxidase 1-like [Lycorma delicatula]|uniref:prenylcysteine oxidase 1-like n=1 Tax=Lycorma delicatula TaxID=130591 RepID=UPI003F50EA81
MSSPTLLFITVIINLGRAKKVPDQHHGVVVSSFDTLKEKPRSLIMIAIIGGGIAGSSTAFFLRELFMDKIDIDIYEKDDVCGRLFITRFDGEDYEVGNWDMIDGDEYIQFFTNRFRKLTYNVKDSRIIYARQAYRNSILSRIKTIIDWIWDHVYNTHIIKLFLKENEFPYKRITTNLRKTNIYSTVEEMIEDTAPEMKEYLMQDIRDVILKYGISEYFYDTVLKAYIRQYSGFQNSTHVFSGHKSLKKSLKAKENIYGGMERLCRDILRNSSSHILHRKVNAILWNNITGKFELITDSETINHYDCVVIATPLAENINKIDFQNFPNKIEVNTEYEKLYYVIAEGNLDQRLGDDIPFVDRILTVNDEPLFVTIHKLKDIFNREKNYPHPLWKIVSKFRLETEQLQNYFYFLKRVHQIDKVTLIPTYKNLEKNHSFILFPKVFYINIIERIDSSVNTLLMGANNVANLVYHSLYYKNIYL